MNTTSGNQPTPEVSIPTLSEIFFGKLGQRFRDSARARKCGVLNKEASGRARRPMRMEALEPRVLLSADFMPEAAAALAGGLDQLESRLDSFFSNEALFDERVPLLLSVEEDGGTVVNEAPRIRDLFTVPVDANADGGVNTLPFSNPADDDESVLKGLDDAGNGDGQVDVGEFLEGWFFEPVRNFLNSVGTGDTTDEFVNFVTGIFPFSLNQTLTDLGNGAFTMIEFEIIGMTDTTENPDAEVTFSIDFELTISQSMPIDLGLEADALKLLAFTGSTSAPESVEVPVTSTLAFGFDFGVFTGGQAPAAINAFDFFIRTADPLVVSVTASDPDLDFYLNIGFLGAQVVDGDFDLQADIETTLLDPNDPVVLGFVDSQHGVESTSGVVTSDNAVPSADLDHAAGFFLRIGNVGITTPVQVADGDAPDLATLKAQIQAALTTAGLDEVITADITDADKVQFALVSTSDTPLGYANENLNLAGIIDATPDGDGPNVFEYLSDQVFLLSVGGALAQLVSVRFPDPAKEEIGFDYAQDASLVDDLVASDAVSASELTADAGFFVTVTLSTGVQVTDGIGLSVADTAGNTDAGDLAADINAELNATLAALVQAVAGVDGRIRFEAIADSVSAIRVIALAGTAQSEIGFAPSAQVTSKLTAADTAISSGDLSGTATFDITVTTVGSGTATTRITVAPDASNGNVADLAADIDDALDSAGLAIDAIAVGSKVVLVAQNVDVAAFDVKLGNQNLDDLVDDVNAALTDAGLAGQVTASDVAGKLRLDTTGGESIEISKTLTFDAGVTYAELLPPLLPGLGTPTSGLFGPAVGADSHATFDLPVEVLPGLEDATTGADDDWDPANVAMVANFSPLGSTAAEYDEQAKRFALHFTLDPTVSDQDTPSGPPVPGSGSLSEQILLFNLAEPLNFNLVTAESMVGLLMGLGTALQQIANSGLFANFDIPFVEATLSDLLNFTDSDKAIFSGLIDTALIFETGGTGIDAWDVAPLDIDDANRLLRRVEDGTEVYLVPNFVTAQELADKLHTLLGVALSGAGGINATYDKLFNQLTYEVDLLAGERTTVTFNAPFEYDVALSPFAKLTVDAAADPADTQVTLTGRTGLEMTFGIDLSPPGGVIFEDTLLADLNGGAGVDIKTTLSVTGVVQIPSVAPDDPTPSDPYLDGDATFSIAIDGGTPVVVTVPSSATFNRSVGDLVADVNNALVSALVTAGLDADAIVADFDGARLVLNASSLVTAFTIDTANEFAEDQLGLIVGTAATRADFVIFGSNGTDYYIVLDDLPADPTVQHVIDLINDVTGGVNVVAGFNATHTGLRLVDNVGGVAQPFKVDSINGSSALLQLGLFGTGNTGVANPFGPGNIYLIEGGPIGLTHLDDRFFVRDAEIRIDGITLQTPDGIVPWTSDTGVPGSALFGIVGVDTILSGSIVANVTAVLQNPVSMVPGSQVSLAQLFATPDTVVTPFAKNDTVAEPTVNTAMELAYDANAFGEFEVGKLLIGATSGATAVVVAVDDSGSTGTLTLSDVEGSFADNEAILQTGVAAASANGVVTPKDNFGEFTLGVHVQDGFDDIGFGDGFALLDGMSYVVPFDLTGFGNPFDPAPPVAVFDDLSGDIGYLAAFEHLDYSHLASALHGLEDLLVDVDESFYLFNTILPAINRSLSDLLHLVDGFERSVGNADAVFDAAILALNAALDLPALRLQDVPQALRGAFGLPTGVDPDGAGAVDWVRLDFDQPNNMLLVDLVLHESLSTKLGLDIEVGSGLPNLTSGGVLKVSGSLDVTLNFGIDLATPEDAWLFDSSSIAADLHVEGEGQVYAGGEAGMGLVFRAALGPLAVFIQDGDVLIDVAFALPALDFSTETVPGCKLIQEVDFDDFLDPVISENAIDIVLPMFYGGEGPDDFLGEFLAFGTLDSVTVSTPDFSGIAADITSGTLVFDPFDNILLAFDTVNFYLEGLSDILSGDVLGIRLPFIGDQMADVLFIEEFRNTLVRTLKNGIENAINPDPDTAVQDLLTNGFGTGVFDTGGLLDGYLDGAIVYTDNVGDAGVDIVDWYRQWNFTLSHTDTLVIEGFDFGILALGFDVSAPVTVTFEWSIDFGFGVNFVEGAYIDVSDLEDLNLDLTITLPSGTHTGRLGFLQLNVTDPGSDTGAVLNFDVDVQNGNDGSAPHIGFSDLGSINPVATLQGSPLPGEDHAVSLHLVTKATLGLPELRTDLLLDWSLPETPVIDLDGDAVTPGIQKIAFNNIELDTLSVAKQLLGPLFDEISGFIEPFMPVVDTLTAPIPILSDLAGEPFTLLDLAGTFGSVDPEFIDAVADILNVIGMINELLSLPVLQLGSLTLYDAGAGIANFDPNDPDSDLADIDLGLLTLDLLDSDGDGLAHDATAFNAAIEGNTFLKAIKDETLADGLTMPIFTDPLQGIMMLLDQNATLVEYELPPLAVEFEYLQVFPVWGPLAVSIEISFGFTVDLHSVGFDTFGYQRYADGGFRNPALIFDGFFLNDLDEDGVDAPEVTFEFGLVGAAELNLGIARAGVGGGINATILFDWHDPIADGHVHISEMLGSIVAEDPDNPIAVFDVSGALTFQMFAFLEISLLGIDEEFPITPETELFSFDIPFERPPVLATDIGGGMLQLNMGPNAEDRLHGDTSDGNEEFFVKYVSGDVLVWSPKLGVDESEAQNYGSGFTKILGLGGEGNDVIELRGFDESGITGEFDGGVGDDRIEYISSAGSTSAAGAVILGGLGNDTLTGGDLNDTITGGEGNDVIKGGAGYDILFGDQGRVASSVDVPYISSRVTLADGDDWVEGGEGDDVLFGAGGNDTLKGDAGNDIIIGDGGRFEYTLTDGHVDVAALRPDAYVPTPVTTPVDPDVISGEIDEIYDAMADVFHATDLGFGGNDSIAGGGDDDMILGGSGDDDIDGEGGDDIILGGKGFDDLHGGTGADSIFGGDQSDTIAGDADNDVISGGSGNDFIHGNAGDDVMKGDSGADVMFGDADNDQVFGQTEPDILFGGIGDDLVVGGTGNDIMFGDDGLVAKLDPITGLGVKVIGIGNAALLAGQFFDTDIRTLDLILTDVVAGDGDDIMSGDAGDDFMLGGGGNDLMGGDVDPRLLAAGSPTEISEDVLIGDGGRITFNERHFRSIETVIGPDATGAPFDDIIYGDNGNDYILGGRGSDFLFGGHGKVVTGGVVGAARGATDADASDNDIIIGDNGEMLFADDTIDENFGVLELIRTTDTSDATGGHEYAEGQLGDDIIFGGVNGSVDVLFGSVGNDVILGDNGELDFAFDGDIDLDTLDLIRSYRDGLGGIDEISGNAGDDVLIGGTAGDEMYGDDATASSGATDGEDIMLGDNADIFLVDTVGRLTVRVADMTTGTAVDLITTTDDDDNALAPFTGGPDIVSGNAKSDIIIGGVNSDGDALTENVDRLFGDQAIPTTGSILVDGDDILLGDNGLLDFTFGDSDRNILDLIRSFEDGLGGTDVISGNKGLDAAIGGTGDDVIYGDDVEASAGASDLGDLLLGDNADIFLVAPLGLGTGPDLKLVLDAAVKTIKTTDEENPGYGGSDTISGNAKGDIIAGGVKGDTLYGDAVSANVVPAFDGDDIILGDNGAFEWLSNGRLSEINTGGAYIDIAANNLALFTKYGAGAFDNDLTTLDLVTTEQPTSGGRDTIYGDEGNDLVFGGTNLDVIHGDDGDEAAETASANRDVLFGDHGRLYPQFSALIGFNSRNFFAIDVGNTSGGEGDRMWGEEGADVMLGQQGDDRMWGGSGDDDMIGGHNVSGGYDELTTPAIVATLNPAVNDLMDGGSGDDAMAGDNAIIWRRGDDFSPRFRLLTETSLYTTDEDSITTNVGTLNQSDPDDAVGRDIELLDHSDAVEAIPLGRFGADVMAGGADSDTMFGELGNDLMQGDGYIGVNDGNSATITRELVITDSGVNPDTDQTLYFNIPEQATDADDYMEGNGGNDLMYGGLGQDDMIGGSSALFGLTTQEERPDGSDIMFGGAGIDISRNNIGDAAEDGTTHVITTTATGHARDADFIMGDNANVFRPVKAVDDFYTFNYDNYGALRIIPRAMQQLDYTLGGGDFADGGYNADGQATPAGQSADNGLADLIHGESGDDYIFGMTGSDVIFGEGQDDDIIGGYGHDWISGGTGQDGVLGDDGLIRTSRNSTLGEPLYGIAGLLASDPSLKNINGNALDEVISTPGDIQIATINVSGELKKTIDVTPFSFDPDWGWQDDEFPDNQDTSPFADDIIFGGLGSDSLHGGSGDDAISGAEALEHAYVPDYSDYDNDSVTAELLDLGYAAVGLPAIQNPGDVLAFNPVDLDGQHLNNRFRAGEFDLYDEYNALRKVLLTPTGELYQGTGGVAGVDFFEFLLNFNEAEGVFRAGGTTSGPQGFTYPAVRDDGKDAIFGDLGNDWLVGGTGRDDIYGGWGNDLLNADDNQDTHGDLNDQPDTHGTYEDRAYGGAGRDVLIANTGGDRLIDWVGEYNSFLVPFAPYGQAAVSRTVMPFLPEFLYALSAADGADPTRVADTGEAALRNGEPAGELGLVLQMDYSWQDQTGAPSDPQAGNIPGGPRDVLRSADFSNGNSQGFIIDSGTWTVKSGRFEVAPATVGGDALSVWLHDQALPSYFELTATINAVKPVAGYKANAFIIFDYFSDTDFKFAGIDVSTNKIEIGQRTAAGWQVLTSINALVKAGVDYNLLLALNGTTATLVLNGQSVTYAFAPRIDAYGIAHNFNDGMIGLGAQNAKAAIDNVRVQIVPPAITLTATDSFSTDTTLVAAETGTWSLSGGRFIGQPLAGQTIALASGDLTVGASYLLQLEAKLSTNAWGGVIFDQYSADDFKWAAVDKASGKVLIGHYTAGKGWVVDASVSRTLGGGDITLTATLKGSTVSVLINGQAALSYVFNAVVTDGSFGLLARNGSASFDSFTVRTDDPAFAGEPGGMALMASTVGTTGGDVPVLDAAAIGAVAQEAIARWNIDPALLAGLTFRVEDLPGLTLAQIDGNTITLDSDAAGHGWFIDESLSDDSEFRIRLGGDALAASTNSEAFGRMDLLTVLTHELGHVMGLDHDDTVTLTVMDDALAAGVRYVPADASGVDQVAQPAAPTGGRPRLDFGDWMWDDGRQAPGAAGRSIAWDASNGEDSAVRTIDWGGNSGWNPLSPFQGAKPGKGSSPNVSDFLLKFAGREGGARPQA